MNLYFLLLQRKTVLIPIFQICPYLVLLQTLILYLNLYADTLLASGSINTGDFVVYIVPNAAGNGAIREGSDTIVYTTQNEGSQNCSIQLNNSRQQHVNV